MSITADSLKKFTNNKVIETEIRNILIAIDFEIKKAHSVDATSINFPVPISFKSNEISNTDMQREVYYGVLKSLQDRSFEVKIHMDRTNTIFHIRWQSDTEQRENNYKNNVLAIHMVTHIKN